MSGSALKLAVLMETSSFLNSTDMFTCVLCDQPMDLAKRRLLWGTTWGDRRGARSLGAKEGGVEKPPKGANAGLGGGTPLLCWEDPVCIDLDGRHRAGSLFTH